MASFPLLKGIGSDDVRHRLKFVSTGIRNAAKGLQNWEEKGHSAWEPGYGREDDAKER